MKPWAVLVILAPFCARAAFEDRPFSARGAGMGGAMAGIVGDPGGAYYNPAGIAFVETAAFTSGYSRVLGLEDLGYGAAAVTFPTGRLGAWSLWASDFGSALYREQEAAVAAGFKISSTTAIGAAVKGQSLRVERYGTAYALQGDLGLAARFLSILDAGVSVRNITASPLGDTGEAPPAVFSAGAALRAWRYGPCALAVRQETGGTASWHFGQEIRFHPALSLRAGFETKPNRFAVGMGLRRAFLGLDYALLSHPEFPDQHLFSFTLYW